MKKLIPLLILSAILSYAGLTRGHLWYDDFASYIMQSQSILNGSTQEFVQRNAFTINTSSYPLGPIAYPWGYPLWIAPVLYFFGLRILLLKLINTLTFSIFLIVFYLIARSRLTQAWSLILTAILAFNPAFLYGHDHIISDIPFLLFSTLTLYLIELWSSTTSYQKQVFIGSAIFLAFFTRTNGVLLLAPLLALQYLEYKKDKRLSLYFTIPYITFAFFFVLNLLLLPRGQESQLKHFSYFFTPARLLGNFVYYIKLPYAMFEQIPAGILFCLFIALCFFIGAHKTWRTNIHLLVYIIVSLGLFIAWPETQGIRFIFPILPLFILIAAQGVEKIEKPAFFVFSTLVILSFSVSGYKGYVNLQNDRSINGPFDEYSSDVFEFIREQTPPDAVVIFFKPRALRLLTDRDSFMTDTCEKIPLGDYVVINEKQGDNGQLTEQALLSCPIQAQLIHKNKRFAVYQILK